jgi:Zinc-ribbon containing domain
MTAQVQAGQRVQETGEFYCTKCNSKVRVMKGDRIPRCPQGHHEFKTATGQPGGKS